MKTNRAIVLFLIFSGSAFSGTLLAQCEKAGTTVATTRCMSNEYEKADAELNRIYKLAFKGLDEKETENLKKAQRAWVIYRDAQCDAEYSKWGGGSGGLRDAGRGLQSGLRRFRSFDSRQPPVAHDDSLMRGDCCAARLLIAIIAGIARHRRDRKSKNRDAGLSGNIVSRAAKTIGQKTIVRIGFPRCARDLGEMWLNRRTTYGFESYSVSPA